MLKHRNIIKSTAEYTRTYDTFEGIAKKGDKKNLLCHTENMFKNRFFGDGEVLESIPGFRVVRRFGGRINGVYLHHHTSGTVYLYVHAGKSLFRTERDDYDRFDLLEKVCDIANTPSRAFSMGGNLYVLDGSSLIEINGDGEVAKITSDTLGIGYIPTTYINGEPHERVNLLSGRFTESFYVSSADDLSEGSYGITYSVTDEERGICAVTGCGELEDGCLCIPKYTVINGRKYRVTEIASGAFLANAEIVSLITPVGLESIGDKAFFGAESLTDIFISNTVKSIGDYCFGGCASLTTIYLGSSLEYISESAFAICTSIKSVIYPASAENFACITNSQILTRYNVRYEEINDSISVAIPISTPTEEITEVLVNGTSWDFYYSESRRAVILYFDTRTEIIGKTVTVNGRCRFEGGFLSTNKGSAIEPLKAILECTVCCVFDGRVFLSGNPRLGGTVFYSELQSNGDSGPLYFSPDSCFTVGADEIPVKGLAEIDGALAILKGSDCDCSDIYFRRPKGQGITKSYTESAPPCRFSPMGSCFRFYDDLIFVTASGLYSISGPSGASAKCISSPINHLLLKEDISKISMCAWGTYLVVAVGNSIFLGDAFPKISGDDSEYQWYYLNGVGSYDGDCPAYRYSDVEINGNEPSPRAGEICESVAYSHDDPNGSVYYYSKENGVNYPLIYTGERTGGTIHKISTVMNSGSLLFFGCDNGGLCVFNNDLCGVIPEHILKNESCDFDAYESEFGNSIHPYFYMFDDHAPRYAVVTAPDDCGVDYLQKTTVPRSTVLRLKSFSGSSVSLRVVTGEKSNRDFPSIDISKTNFEDTDFSSFTGLVNPVVTVGVNDRSRGWIQKQLVLISEKPYSPFGVYSMSYRYKLWGTIKNKSL